MLHVRKPGELGNDWRRVPLSVRLGKAEGRNTSVYASEQSDRPIGPEKPPNKGFFNQGYPGHGPAEVVEERGLTKGNLFQVDKYCPQWQEVDMVNSKRARREKSRIRPRGSTYVKPKDLSSGLKRVREVANSASALPPKVGAG
jgi:hypothetical protein